MTKRKGAAKAAPTLYRDHSEGEDIQAGARAIGEFLGKMNTNRPIHSLTMNDLTWICTVGISGWIKSRSKRAREDPDLLRELMADDGSDTKRARSTETGDAIHG